MADLPDNVLDQLFRSARTYNGFTDEPVPDAVLHQLYELLKWGPTAFNCQPARYLFLKSAAEKARLKPTLLASNVDKTMAAPVAVIIAYDTKFYEHLPAQFPAYDAKPIFESNPALAETAAFRNGTLQGAYLMIAARALGLSCGPMSGFDPVKVNQTFFPEGRYKANFLCNLGIGDPAQVYPRGPRLNFADVAQIL